MKINENGQFAELYLDLCMLHLDMLFFCSVETVNQSHVSAELLNAMTNQEAFRLVSDDNARFRLVSTENEPIRCV